MSGFERHGGELRAEGASLEDAAARFGTPLYVYSQATLTSAYRAYDSALAPVPHRICYAVKANATRALLEVVHALGGGADVVSGLELRAARRAGFAAAEIVFSGVGKTDAELELGLQEGIGCFNAESEDEIRRLSALAVASGRRAAISLRVNPDIDARSHPYISTGLRENKFGVDIAQAREVLRHARGLPGVNVVGLQCHIGSQMREVEPMLQAARELVALSRELLDDGFALETIDVGGGLGIDYERSGVPGPEVLAARLVPLLDGLPLTLLVEPGRSLVGPAGVLLTRVLSVKQNRGKRFVIVDAGMNDLLRPSLYAAHHEIEPVTARERPSRVVDVVGPVCETGDFLAHARELEEVLPGELLAVRDVGAYGFVMASNYNLRPRPAEGLATGGELRLIRRRETFEDLIATEVV